MLDTRKVTATQVNTYLAHNSNLSIDSIREYFGTQNIEIGVTDFGTQWTLEKLPPSNPIRKLFEGGVLEIGQARDMVREIPYHLQNNPTKLQEYYEDHYHKYVKFPEWEEAGVKIGKPIAPTMKPKKRVSFWGRGKANPKPKTDLPDPSIISPKKKPDDAVASDDEAV